ncbi:MAG: DUF971 domain-containing protein [Anaerolineae bacterium]|nr:DUF971 domain-containing protein [Anaerolineae bacterium]
MSASLEGLKPAGIVVDLETRQIQFKWSDSNTSTFDFDTLRRACPCAECRPWIHDLTGSSGSHEPSEAVKTARGELKSLQDIQPVGSYAIHFDWADGHVTGIYDWKYLRELDPTLVNPTTR